MLTLTTKIIELEKMFPLQISRGTSKGSKNVFVEASDGVHIGLGECAPGTGDDEDLVQRAVDQINSLKLDGLSIHEVFSTMELQGIERPVMAGVDIALWDLLGKQAGLPLYKVLGLSNPTVPTSITVGINPQEVIRERIPLIVEKWTSGTAKALKIKLGTPEGIERDKSQYEAAREAAKPFGLKLRVDANGGWGPNDAVHMIEWLSERDCDYVEQPLVKGNEDALPEVFSKRKLPIFLDESIHTASDVVKFADQCDGVNIKLMKTGGLTEALRVVATARVFGLKTMIGCMGESSVAIAAGCAIGSHMDYIDLDSHLNLNPDPAEGLTMVEGVVLPSENPGHGAFLKPC